MHRLPWGPPVLLPWHHLHSCCKEKALMILQSGPFGRRFMRIIGFPNLHHFCDPWEQHTPPSGGPVDLHKKIMKARALLRASDHHSGRELWGETVLGPVTYIRWRPGEDQSLSAGFVEPSAKGECFSHPCSSLFAGPLQTAWLRRTVLLAGHVGCLQ